MRFAVIEANLLFIFTVNNESDYFVCTQGQSFSTFFEPRPLFYIEKKIPWPPPSKNIRNLHTFQKERQKERIKNKEKKKT